MTNRLLFVLTFVSSLGCGLIGGVFFAFSTFVMPALARLPAAQGVAAMQSINVAVINPAFLLAFMGTAATCGLQAILSLSRWPQPGVPWCFAGGVLYLVGTIGVTFAFNIPRNKALAAVAPESAAAASLWPRYLAEWNVWNHVRGAAALVAGALLIVALLQGKRP
jgi:uncharacterized membrane protein